MINFKKDAQFVIHNTRNERINLIFLNVLKLIIVFLEFAYRNVESLIIDAGLNFQPDKPINTPWYLKFLVGGKFGQLGTLKLLIVLAIVFFVILLLINTFKYYQGTLSVYFRAKNRVKLRSKAFTKFCKRNQNYNNGELFNLLKDDITGVGDFYYLYIPSIIMDLFNIFMAITTLVEIDFYLLLMPLIAAPILLTFCIIYIKKLYNTELTIREQNAQLRAVTQENLEGMKTLKLFNITDFSKQRFKKKNIAYTTSLVEKNLLSNRYDLIFNIIKKSTYLISLLVGGILAIKGRISIGQFLVFTVFVNTLLDNITTIVSDFANSKLCILKNRKLQNFFEQSDDIYEIDNPKILDINGKYDLSIDKLKMSIDGKSVLSNISVSLPASSSVGVIGGSGSGKTALIKAIMRILPYDNGSIKIGGENITELQLENLRNLISYHMQNPTLFNISIRQNLTYSGSSVSDERIAQVLKQTYTQDVLSQVTNGLNYVLNDGGNSLGVYKRRLSLCRAILKDSPYYILDDFGHGYSDDERKHLCKNIIELLPNKTLIMMSNNYQDVKSCKYILKLDKGKVQFFGTSQDYSKIEKEVQNNG